MVPDEVVVHLMARQASAMTIRLEPLGEPDEGKNVAESAHDEDDDVYLRSATMDFPSTRVFPHRLDIREHG